MKRRQMFYLMLILLYPLAAASDSPKVPNNIVKPETARESAIEVAAVEAARAWLLTVDKSNYDESWQSASTYFKQVITKENWSSQVASVRKPLGDLVERKVTSTQYATSLPGAPDGEYVVIQFETAFKNKASAVETVTPKRESDGSWKVSGYYIR